MPGYVQNFAELGKDDTAIAGGKGANLGELTKAGFPVPSGFVVIAQAYLASLDRAVLRIGWAPVESPSLPATPRRALAEVFTRFTPTGATRVGATVGGTGITELRRADR